MFSVYWLLLRYSQSLYRAWRGVGLASGKVTESWGWTGKERKADKLPLALEGEGVSSQLEACLSFHA